MAGTPDAFGRRVEVILGRKYGLCSAYFFCFFFVVVTVFVVTGSSDPPEKIFYIFATENEVYTIYQLLRYFRLNIIRLKSKIILDHMNSIG